MSERGKVENARIEDYRKFLKEKHRPPSRGGNTGALHAHVITVDGVDYSFLSPGSQQWAFKSDTVSFEYEVKKGYRNIVKETFVTFDKQGNEVVRGNRGYKPKLRTAEARMPVSRREMSK